LDQIKIQGLAYILGLKRLNTSEHAMDCAIHLKVVFDRVQLHESYCMAGLENGVIESAFATLVNIASGKKRAGAAAGIS
jgi:hypothetical protein